MEIQVCSDRNSLLQAYQVMRELRTSLSVEAYLSLYEEAHHRDGYEVVAAVEGGRLLAVMGYRFLYDFVHGKHLYIDDLAVVAEMRSRGIGAALLEYAEKLAAREGCRGLRLCTGVENEKAKRFYEREGWTARALAFKKQIRPV